MAFTIKRLTIICLSVLGILLINFMAMFFTSEVNWSAFDFMVAGILLFGIGLSIDQVLLRVKTLRMRLVLCGLILFGLFLLWAELAVGIFGSPIAGS